MNDQNKIQISISQGDESRIENTRKDLLNVPDSSRHRHGSTSSMVSNDGFASAQGTPQGRRGTQVAQTNTTGAHLEGVCDQIDEELLKIRLLLQDMAAATAKQKNISQVVKNGMTGIECAAGAIFEYQQRIREVIKGQLVNAPERTGQNVSSNTNKRPRDATTNREDTPTKKSRKETTQETGWQTVASQRKKRNAAAEREAVVKEAAPIAAQRPKLPKRRNDVVVIQPSAGKTYAQILGALKEKMKPEDSGVVLKSIRKTQKGAVLLELRKETADKETFRKSIQEVIGDAGQVRSPNSTVTIEIRDIDCLTTREDVQAALIRETGKTTDFKVHVFEPNSREQKIALANVDEEIAVLLLKKGRIKIGWMNCGVRQRLTVIRCHRCLGYGHTKANCKGKDRSAACWKCGKEGHKAKVCQNRPDTPGCFLCLEKPEIKDKAHFPGTGACSVFRAALAQQKKTNQ